MITIIIADDHKIFRQGLSRLLADDDRFKLLGEASNGKEALNLIWKEKPQVAVLDLSMPRPDGLEVVSNIRAAHSNTRCIILTMKDDVETVRRALESGVYGYVLKEAAYEEIAEAIVKVADNKLYLGRFQDNPNLYASCCEGQLTNREVEVLRCVVRGLTSRQIASELFISHRTVETHRQHIMEKLNIRTATGLAGYAREHGLI
ncbi:MAG: response regulator transcription factor [Chlorobium phaeobacteroides]|jgi:DNA-binding NarL/FixJ family response regulator|nr:response regulator transcription factor [Chlorobium phaeobacteroides]